MTRLCRRPCGKPPAFGAFYEPVEASPRRYSRQEFYRQPDGKPEAFRKGDGKAVETSALLSNYCKDAKETTFTTERAQLDLVLSLPY
jgi:hypothetical protein